jgi:5-formyltetrahydrofolate cyclo-ligase
MSARNLFAVYLASADEIDLSPLLAALTVAEVPLAAPRWDGTTYALARLRRQHVDANGQPVFALRKGPHCILEPMDDDRVAPAEVAIWIVPGLAFAADGRRLGYGGGWYDRFLSAAAPDARKLGVAYPFQLFADLPTEPHDCVLSDVVLP